MPENKVAFGLSNAHYAIVTYTDNVPSYSAPVAIPGAVELGLDGKGETTDFFADNRLYYTSSSNQGYEGTLTIAEIPESFRKDVLKEVLDETSLTMTESANTKPATFALIFEFDGDIKATRHVLYHCTVSRPSVSSSTKTEATEPQTRELAIVAAPRPIDGVVKRSTTSETPALTYDGWFDTVFDIA